MKDKIQMGLLYTGAAIVAGIGMLIVFALVYYVLAALVAGIYILFGGSM